MHFREAHLKIQWADHHIANLERRISSLPDRCTSTIRIDPAAANDIIRYDLADATAADDIALMLGDAIHNLRCALDYAWLKVVERVPQYVIDNSTKFPVRESVKELEGALKKKRLDTLSPGLHVPVPGQWV